MKNSLLFLSPQPGYQRLYLFMNYLLQFSKLVKRISPVSDGASCRILKFFPQAYVQLPIELESQRRSNSNSFYMVTIYMHIHRKSQRNDIKYVFESKYI